jgi:hypothetical protein
MKEGTSDDLAQLRRQDKRRLLSPSAVSQAGMNPRAVMRMGLAGQPIMNRSVRRVLPCSLLKIGA